jgi:hypothetical protein
MLQNFAGKLHRADASPAKIAGGPGLQLRPDVVCQALNRAEIRIDPQKYFAPPGEVPPKGVKQAVPSVSNSMPKIMPESGEDRDDGGSGNAIDNIPEMPGEHVFQQRWVGLSHAMPRRVFCEELFLRFQESSTANIATQ